MRNLLVVFIHGGKVAEMNKEMEDLSLEQLDVLWEEAKQTER